MVKTKKGERMHYPMAEKYKSVDLFMKYGSQMFFVGFMMLLGVFNGLVLHSDGFKLVLISCLCVYIVVLLFRTEF